MSDIIGGIEGGSSHSTIVLLDSSGKIIAKQKGPCTNHFLLGMEETWKRIAEMVNAVKTEAGIPLTTPLKALGLSLSGCEKEETNTELARGLKEAYKNLSENYAVGSDTDGSIAATSNKGGVTCIAGTGSNTVLINTDGSKVQCGGYGYMLGDEGSAWKIAHTAIKICINDLDGFDPCQFPIKNVWNKIKEHFDVKAHIDLLDHMYTKFDKAKVAALCKKLVPVAESGDDLAKHVFEQAGMDLARAISAVIPKASKELSDKDGGIHILCVGSVWSSWELLKSGFVKFLYDCDKVDRLSLMKIRTTIAVGAAYMASDRLNLSLQKEYSKNYEVFYRYEKNVCNGVK